jgi:hypothetical protein
MPAMVSHPDVLVAVRRQTEANEQQHASNRS